MKLSTLRRRKYRRFLFTEEELREKADTLFAQLQALEALFRHCPTDDSVIVADIVAQYILTCIKNFRPKDYLGGPHNVDFGVNVDGDCPHVLIFNHHSIRSIPLAVNRALVNWSAKRFHLKVLDYIPNAREILRFQTLGTRVVTLFFKKEELGKWVNGVRDPLGFVLHDLIHADHFFRDAALARGQQDFYIKISQDWDDGKFKIYLENDPQFVEHFEYIISDMNSHPLHLEQTLNAVIKNSAKKISQATALRVSPFEFRPKM